MSLNVSLHMPFVLADYPPRVRSESAAEAELAPRHVVSSQTLATSLDEELRSDNPLFFLGHMQLVYVCSVYAV
jgi:hypothetical protein